VTGDDIKAEAQRVIAAQNGTLTRFEECSAFYGWTAYVGGKTVVGELVNVDSDGIEKQILRDIAAAGVDLAKPDPEPVVEAPPVKVSTYPKAVR